ncbi:biotin--[acetyl-CoA-carboxylase] ligase [Crocosphaera sp. UHCC 0190]|uniref:biotin--[acetyl-CoA-carboxylase] ligase n=1 Tax=Crocosphaera sp. UHCC 0190 TaxID=3110246 RepID=UPI002B206531|nr:biotin--[acetyl-CoA-carboxylase] ligase [Crocosphaera sp. UHCC 0190]MEA5509078.1 biotin--[acetyl-CoA-carboxylase] ligase [Crocosphaera sp. UHCC 0190]
MMLNQQLIATNLSPPVPLDSLVIHVFETVTSTNQILWELLDAGKKPPLVAIAAQQTAGRGQWGRSWYSPPGGLYLSLALPFNLLAHNAPHLTLLSAWGIAKALHKHNLPLKLKWPNDLILEGRKLGGIKSETRIQQGIIYQGIIGIGINWDNPVPETGINLQSFFKTQNNSTISSLEALAALTIQGVFEGYQYYCSQGIEWLLKDYLTMLESLGRTVTIEGARGIITGVTPLGELKVSLKAPGAKTEIHLPPGSISLGYD